MHTVEGIDIILPALRTKQNIINQNGNPFLINQQIKYYTHIYIGVRFLLEFKYILLGRDAF